MRPQGQHPLGPPTIKLSNFFGLAFRCYAAAQLGRPLPATVERWRVDYRPSVSQAHCHEFPNPASLKRAMYENKRLHLNLPLNLELMKAEGLSAEQIYGAILGKQVVPAPLFIRYIR